tara:strand:+ start:2499 stop:2714 length:216 start_codon:yes stop_codon:yes gene_type:complete
MDLNLKLGKSPPPLTHVRVDLSASLRKELNQFSNRTTAAVIVSGVRDGRIDVALHAEPTNIRNFFRNLPVE